LISYGARQHIRKNALQHLHQEVTLTRRQGSSTFEEARSRAAHAKDFETALRAGPG
jgi:hypothetical protein